MNVESLILCEGITDQTLLGCYIEAVSEWKYIKNPKNNPFANETNVVWYSKKGNTNEILGVWSVGGDSFDDAISKICDREIREHAINRLLIITDNDDNDASEIRPKTIVKLLNNRLSAVLTSDDVPVNKYDVMSWEGIFGRAQMELGYMLVPLDSNGALETFMLEALSENRPEWGQVIQQVECFLENFKSAFYLKSRRERVKAKLGVSLGIMDPDKSFFVMKELIDCVDWANYQASFEQFKMLREVL